MYKVRWIGEDGEKYTRSYREKEIAEIRAEYCYVLGYAWSAVYDEVGNIVTEWEN